MKEDKIFLFSFDEKRFDRLMAERDKTEASTCGQHYKRVTTVNYDRSNSVLGPVS